MQRSTSPAGPAARPSRQTRRTTPSAKQRAPMVVMGQHPMDAGPAAAASHAATTLPPEAYLTTLLTLVRSLTEASAAVLQLEDADGWRYLAKVAANDHDLSRIHALTQEPSNPGGDRPGSELCLVQIPTRPALRMALLVPRALTPAAVDLPEQLLRLAVPIVKAAVQERQLREAYRALLELEADLAQELRTPLTAVAGFTQLLRRSGEIDERRRTSYAAIASEETEQVAMAINQILAKVQRHAAALSAAGGGFLIDGEGTADTAGPNGRMAP